ncbi:MAG: endonuclease [Opitutus sp.]|nr:endonuclease [Opitutus sp.]
MLRFLQRFFSFGPRVAADAGGCGERLAADWLQRERRFVLVTRNWRSPRDRRLEIDLVCRDGEALVFVEVKARSADALVPGYHAIDRRKKRALRRAIEAYLVRLSEKPRTFRFDVVEVSFPLAAPDSNAATVEPQVLHFENVPLFSKHFRA